MKYPEEDYARHLYAVLIERFGSSALPTTVLVDGAGVHWACTATRNDSSCKTSCFDLRGPEYYTVFSRGSAELATARTSDRDGTACAIGEWLEGSSVSALYNRYSFVDADKRALSSIRDDVSESVPELANAVELKHRGADIYELDYIHGDRSCTIAFYGKNAQPDARFAWDDCQLFEYQPTSNHQLATVLRRWVWDHTQPSKMRQEFPALEIGSLADFYERGNPVEGEFLCSWDSIEKFYNAHWCTFSTSVLALIRAMRDAGYDRRLRAGQSMASLCLSRSRRHGLGDRQPYLRFNFHESTMDVFASFLSAEYKHHPFRLTDEVRQTLDSLAEFDID